MSRGLDNVLVVRASYPRSLTTLRLAIQGNNQFAEREYQKALDTYDKAVKMLPDASTEKADILCNKAACYIQVSSCSAAHVLSMHMLADEAFQRSCPRMLCCAVIHSRFLQSADKEIT